MRRLKLPHCCLCSPAYSFDKGDSSCTIVLHLKNKTKLSISDAVCGCGKKFSRIYFAVIWFILFLVAIAFFLLSPTTKWFSKEFAILDEIISLIIVCFWTYRFMVPSFVKSKRRNWYKKILPEQSASLYVQISASHLEFCSATGKSVIFSYKPQTKKGERNLPKKDQTIGEIIEAKNGIYFCGFRHRTC